MSAELPADVKGMLELGEEVLWTGKPVRAPFLLKSLTSLTLAAAIMAMPAPFYMAAPPGMFRHLPVIAFFVFWYGIACFLGFGPLLYNYLVWKNLYYVVTSKRLIIRKGVIGIDYDTLSLDLVQQVNVDVGFWDQKYGTGMLTIRAVGVEPLSLICIPSPLEVYKLIKRAVERIKGRGSAQL